jgi:heptosyltransferase-1
MRQRYRSDLVLDFQGLLRSALVARCCASQICAGLSDAREGARFFYNRVAKVQK